MDPIPPFTGSFIGIVHNSIAKYTDLLKIENCQNSYPTYYLTLRITRQLNHSEVLASKISRGYPNPEISYLWTFVLHGLFYFGIFYKTVKISDFHRARGFCTRNQILLSNSPLTAL